MKLLVVEDEPKLNKGLVEGLQNRGFVVDSAFDGRQGEEFARVNEYDLIILDVMMPERDGFTVCKNLRDAGVGTPILFLTARDATDDKVAGLNLGADDYVVKPFSFDELVARIRSVLRRPAQVASEVLEWEGVEIDTRTQRVTVRGEGMELTLKEFLLLEYLVRNKGAVVTREDVLSNVWDRFFDSFSNVVDVHVKNLRKKIPEEYAKRIETVWGKGYRLV